MLPNPCNYLKLFKMPKGGLEPPQVSPLPPQDSVSTSSTTSAVIVQLLRSPQERGVQEQVRNHQPVDPGPHLAFQGHRGALFLPG